jgi:hypothetical protein
MMTFDIIKKDSTALYKKFNNKKYNKSIQNKFNLSRIPLEFLMLRILYIIINLKDAKDKEYEYYAKLLNIERISLTYQIVKK